MHSQYLLKPKGYPTNKQYYNFRHSNFTFVSWRQWPALTYFASQPQLSSYSVVARR